MTQQRIMLVGLDSDLASTLAVMLLPALAARGTHYDIQLVSADCTTAASVQAIAQDPLTKMMVFEATTLDEASVASFRKTRKDLFVVGVLNSVDENENTQYSNALKWLKNNSLNLVLALDEGTGRHMIVAPEETQYATNMDMNTTVLFLSKMLVSRMHNHFTRSTVIPAEPVSWTSEAVPNNLRDVVNHCIRHGAYKPVLGKTAGHFAVKVNDTQILTSIRKSNFNDLNNVGLVKVESVNDDQVLAYGARPSVGGQSQRKIFAQHPETNIVHFHCPVKSDAPLFNAIPIKDQWPNECGSHECGQNTSDGLRIIDLGDGDTLKVVFLDNHGPNIVFSNKTPANKVMHFIDANFDLSAKTGGLVPSIQGLQ